MERFCSQAMTEICTTAERGCLLGPVCDGVNDTLTLTTDDLSVFIETS